MGCSVLRSSPCSLPCWGLGPRSQRGGGSQATECPPAASVEDWPLASTGLRALSLPQEPDPGQAGKSLVGALGLQQKGRGYGQVVHPWATLMKSYWSCWLLVLTLNRLQKGLKQIIPPSFQPLWKPCHRRLRRLSKVPQ